MNKAHKDNNKVKRYERLVRKLKRDGLNKGQRIRLRELAEELKIVDSSAIELVNKREAAEKAKAAEAAANANQPYKDDIRGVPPDTNPPTLRIELNHSEEPSGKKLIKAKKPKVEKVPVKKMPTKTTIKSVKPAAKKKTFKPSAKAKSARTSK